MTPAIFPWYVSTPADRAELEFWCEAQLQTWRTAKLRHLAAMDQGGSRWAALAVAFDALRTAYRSAMTYTQTQDLAASQQQTITTAA